MKRILCTTLIVILLFCLCACKAPEQLEVGGEASIEMLPAESTPNPAPEASPSSAPEAAASPEVTPAPSESVAEATGVSVDIFFGNDNADKLLSETYLLPELSAQNILNALAEAGVFSESVTANSFTVDNYNVIHLDLDDAFSRQICSMGTSGEYIMMGSLVNSFLKAFEADGMALTVNGSVLESGHTIYDFTLTYFEN